MMPTEKVTFTCPDGVEREVRFTLGARKRIAEKFGEPNIQTILTKHGDGCLPDVLFLMMYDAEGQPPKGLTVTALAEGIVDPLPVLAALMSAATSGATPKNALEALLRTARQAEVEKLIGSTFGVSPGNASDSPMQNSGGSPSGNSTPSASDSESMSDQPMSAPV